MKLPNRQSFLPRRRSWSRRFVLVSSIGLHVAVAIALLASALLHVEELPPPEVALTFVSQATPAPIPTTTAPVARSSLGKKRVRVRAGAPRPRSSPVERVERPSERPAETGHAPAPSVDERPAGGPAETHGEAPVAPGPPAAGAVAPPPEPRAARPPPAPAGGRLIPSFVMDRERLRGPLPKLPEDFVRQHARKTVYATYRICITEGGRVSGVSVVSSLSGADDAIMAQISRDWVYKPQPLPVCTVQVLTFTID